MKRSRGRGRRGPPGNHNRAFDSAGPDVKIRGTAANIYEKYLQLARDAGSSGDRVAQENFLQHAEHYYRIMMAAQPQYPQQGGYQHGQQQGVQSLHQAQYAPPQAGDGRGAGAATPPYGQPAPGSGPSFTLSDGGAESEEGDLDKAEIR